MEKFAAKIDLSVFFDDERRFVLILVDPSWENVEKLQQRVEEIFEVQSLRFLTNEGYLLPPQEKIEVVKFANDVLKAFIPTEVLVEKKRKKLNKISQEVAEIDNDNGPPGPPQHTAPQKKRKLCSSLLNGNDFVSSTPNLAKRTRRVFAEREPQTSNKSSKISSKNEQLSTINEKKATEKQEITPKLVEEHCTQKKRKRPQKQKGKVVSENLENISVVHLEDGLTGQAALPACSPSTSLSKRKSLQIGHKTSTVNSSQLYDNQNKTYYSNSEEMSTKKITANDRTQQEPSVEEVPKSKVIFCCKLSQVKMNKPRIFTLTPKYKPKESIQIQEIILIKPRSQEANVTETQTESVIVTGNEDLKKCADEVISVQMEVIPDASAVAEEQGKREEEKQSVCNESSIIAVDSFELHGEHALDTDTDTEESSVIDLNETEETEVTAHEISRGREILNDSEKKEIDTGGELTVKKILPFCSVLDKLPDIGDIIVFKMFRLNNACAPGISSFIAGRCEYTNKRTKNIKLYIIDGQEDIGCLPAKFACNFDDSTETKYINIKFSEMIDAKVFKMS